MVHQRGDVGFDRFFDTMYRRLRREAYCLCRDWFEADDLAQEAMIRIYGRWRGLARRDQLLGYVRRVLLTTYLQERRQSRFNHEISYADPAGDLLVTHVADDRVMLVLAVGQLPSRQRTIVFLRYFLDLTVMNTASIVGCPAGTVTSETRRTLGALRQILAMPPHD